MIIILNGHHGQSTVSLSMESTSLFLMNFTQLIRENLSANLIVYFSTPNELETADDELLEVQLVESLKIDSMISLITTFFRD